MRILLALCVFAILGCSESKEPIPAGLKYFPEIDLLEEGLVFKYYFHQGKKNGPPKTDIRYRKMILKGDIIITHNYNAAFQKTFFSKIQIEGSTWKSLEEKTFNYRNSYKELYNEYSYSIKENLHTDWSSDDAFYEREIVFDEFGNRVQRIQTELKDSIADGKKIKIILGKNIYSSLGGDEENEPVEYITSKIFEEGLGMTHRVIENEEMLYELVLDEIMTIEEYERRANHGTHRVAYIDTLKTIDDHSLFRPCFHPAKINDYYNEDRAGFIGGKGRLRVLLNDKLDASKLEGQSGFLTYRFVVNCNGEAGWFVTEEAELNYEKKQFSEDCRNHLYEIIKEVKEWKSLKVRNESRDAYTYLTFKIKNGEIIELLP